MKIEAGLVSGVLNIETGRVIRPVSKGLGGREEKDLVKQLTESQQK